MKKPGRNWGRFWVTAIPYAWMLAFFLVPFIIVLKISFSASEIAQPPYVPALDWADGLSGWWEKLQSLSFDNYQRLVEDSIYIRSYLSSIVIAAVSTFLMLLIGYPLAYGMARAPRTWRTTLLMLVILPFWTSFLIRVYAWIGILRPDGLLDTVLIGAGLTSEPLRLLNTETAVLIGLTYSYLPFMVLPLFAALQKLDASLLEAAADLGATPARAFLSVTLPLSLPGVLAGCALVFIPAIGEFVIPDLLGGADTTMLGKTLWTEFFSNRDWPLASAVAVVLLVVLVLPLALLQRARLLRGEAA